MSLILQILELPILRNNQNGEFFDKYFTFFNFVQNYCVFLGIYALIYREPYRLGTDKGRYLSRQVEEASNFGA